VTAKERPNLTRDNSVIECNCRDSNEMQIEGVTIMRLVLIPERGRFVYTRRYVACGLECGDGGKEFENRKMAHRTVSRSAKTSDHGNRYIVAKIL
jgi:hypothetical protein